MKNSNTSNKHPERSASSGPEKKANEEVYAHFKNVFEAAPGAYLLLLPDQQFTIAGVSDAYNAATMTTREAIVGHGLFEIFPDNPEDANADGTSNLRASLQNVITNKREHRMEIQKYDIRRPDGIFEERHWSPLNKPVLDDSGEVSYIIHHVEDVTSFVKLKREARDNQQIFSYVFMKGPVMNSITDASTGEFIEVNERFIEFCGLPKEEIIGKSSLDLNLIADPEHREEIIRSLKEEGSTRDMVMRIRRKNEMRWVSTSADMVNLNGKDCFLTAMVDITERKSVQEKLAEANKELESFTYSVSHDLRAPLRAIDGYARILVEEYAGKFDEEGKRLMNVITSNTAKMARLIDDLLSFSRLGKQQMIRVKVNMMKLAGSSFEEMMRTSVRKDTEIIIHTIPELECDSSMMRLVFNNLISNAIKYSGKKEKPLVEIGSVVKDMETVYYIKDNGAGFDMNYYDKLFGVFQRLHSAVEFEGTGVGLALTQRIIHRHGGKIWAESELDKGATFYFTIPKIKTDQ